MESEKKYRGKKVYMYDLGNNLIQVFDTTNECANFFGCDNMYINHNLKYCSKKRKDDKWYVLKREEIK